MTTPAGTPPPGSPPPAGTPPPGAPPAGTPSPTPPPAGTPPPANPPPAGTPPPGTPPAPEPTPNLLDDTPPAGSPPPAGTPPPGAPPAPDAAQVETFVKGIPTDLGFDATAINAVAPAFLKHGLKPEQAADIMGAYAGHVKAQVAAAAKQEADAIAALTTATKTALGNDLPTFVADAKKGGLAFFGKELWDVIRSVPALTNDVRMIKALASYGRSVRTDDGSSNNSGGGANEKPLGQRWRETSQPK